METIMKKQLLAFLSISTLIFSLTAFAIKKGKESKLTFASYNIRRKGKDAKKHQWDNRKTHVIKIIETIQPDILGLQEPIKDQIDDLLHALSNYEQFGESRESTIEGLSLWHRIARRFATDEFNPLFYNKKRVTLLESGTFNISRGLTFQQTGWLPRICTWGFFKDNKSSKKFYVFNTHLDHMYDTARINNMQNLINYIKSNAKDYPVILMGDFNTEITDQLNVMLDNANFVHTREIAQKISGPEETATGWNNNNLKVIDYIFVTKNSAQVSDYTVVETPGKFPSDHRPVYTMLVFGK